MATPQLTPTSATARDICINILRLNALSLEGGARNGSEKLAASTYQEACATFQTLIALVAAGETCPPDTSVSAPRRAHLYLVK